MSHCEASGLPRLATAGWVQVRKSWDLLRSKLQIGWALDDFGSITIMDIVTPPTVFLGVVNSSALHDGLWAQSHHAAICKFLTGLRKLAQFSFSIRECDAHAINTKHMVFERKCLLSDSHPMLVSYCGLHSQSRNTKCIAQAVADEIQHSPFISSGALARWLGMGNYYIRAVLSADEVSDSFVRVVYGDPCVRLSCFVAFAYSPSEPASQLQFYL